MTFNRIFSKTMYKNHRISLGEMSFAKDFVNTDRGDLYPVIQKAAECEETVIDNRYLVHGQVERLMGAFFPYATYAVHMRNLCGHCGFWFQLTDDRAYVYMERTAEQTVIRFKCNQSVAEYTVDDPEENVLMVSCRPGALDVFMDVDNYPKFITTFECEEFETSDYYEKFSSATAGLYVNGDVEIHLVESYLDCGLSQADMRPIRYENGEVMVENGKVYLTMTVRLRERMHQGVFSWIPGTSQFEMTGAIFYDAGNGRWGFDVAASVLYHRETKNWYIWVCSFSNEHILGHAVCEGDIRFGVNVVDIELMEEAEDTADISVFKGIKGDEDPDFYYDEERKKWYMAICRMDQEIHNYRYVFFESDSPFEGYRYIGKGLDGAETGGSFVKIGKKRYFICGNSFKETSNYRIYSEEGMTTPTFNYPDGGFRGWGTLIPVKLGTRTRYFWMTFDRHNSSDYNWSYGNVYCFEGSIYG